MNEGELIFAAGALAGAVGSLWFIARSVPRTGPQDRVGRRKLALSIVLVVYAAMALLAAITGLLIRDTSLAGVAGLMVLFSIVGLAVVWQSDAA